MNLSAILGALHDAAAAKISGVANNLAPLNAEALDFVTKTIAPALHVPPSVVTIVAGSAGTIDKAVEPFEIATLQFFQTRIFALLQHL